MDESKPPPLKPLFKRPRFNAPAQKTSALINGTNKAGDQRPLPVQKDAGNDATKYYFQVLYCKYQPTKKLRKNKNFNDGILEVSSTTTNSTKAVLYDPEGKLVSQSNSLRCTPSTLGAGSELVLGGWELEIDSSIEAQQFLSGQCFIKSSSSSTAAVLAAQENKAALSADVIGIDPVAAKTFIPPKAPGMMGAFKRPFKPLAGFNVGGVNSNNANLNNNNTNTTGQQQQQQQQKAFALHDPHQPNTIILNPTQWQQGQGINPRTNKPISPVVLDPFIARHLRPHQVEGVKFLYECTMGLRDAGRLGCVLGDEMGLGKTLQVLALMWTLLKQGPFGKPTINKVLVVTPSSLTRNWAEEVKKWLGDERLKTMIIAPGADGAQQVVDFKHGQVVRVAIISYDTLRKHAQALTGVPGLLIADEGHRLKSAQGNKTISALCALNCPRRVLLTGTPIQNNLEEFFAMVDFVNPDSLGSLAVFNRVFGLPIARNKDKNASVEEKALGEQREKELSLRVSSFLLRRTAEINAKYLPTVTLFVVFCKPSDVQLQRYSALLGSGAVRKLFSGGDFGDMTLSVLTELRKICNHPLLVESTADRGGDDDMKAEEQRQQQENDKVDINASGKVSVLCTLLHSIIHEQNERCVVVSQSTQMLDIISTACIAAGYSTVRIDGKTDVSKRQDVVNAFNKFGVGQIFLLSTTAGGAGLNLIGASRLILVDSHWNPAMDEQAMARIWRDKQTKPCVVYRLLTTGTVEEKIYQRQRAKSDIASIMGGGGGGGANGGLGNSKKKGGGHGKAGQFSREELKQLFTLRTNTMCDTADVLKSGVGGGEHFVDVSGLDSGNCSDGGSGVKGENEACEGDVPLLAAVEKGGVTFVHLERKQGGGIVAAANDDGDIASDCEEKEDDVSEQQQQQQQQQEEEGKEQGIVDTLHAVVTRGDAADELQVDDDDSEW